ncbi:MAG: aldo/keto reductase [Planctomycetes bacterium]|nr:aldo/keto reductase [Planctomycetota bacterium]
MHQRVLGRTGIAVSEIGVGAWQLGGPLILDGKPDGHPDIGEAAAIALIQRCGDELGIDLVDTAEQYGAGESERRVGKALAGRRDRWAISTKFGALVGPGGERINDPSAARVPVSLEGSLRRLRTDRVDIYLCHVGPEPRELDGVAGALAELKRAGKVRAVGISTANPEHCRWFLDRGMLDIVQYPRSLLSAPDEPVSALVAASGAGGIVRGAFAGGRLCGKYFDRPPAFAADDIRGNWFQGAAADQFRRCAVFRELVDARRTMPQLALRWLLDQPATHSIILGAKRFEEYRDAVGASALPALTEAERARVAALRAQAV